MTSVVTTDSVQNGFLIWFEARSVDEAIDGLTQHAKVSGGSTVVGTRITAVPVYRGETRFLAYGTCI